MNTSGEKFIVSIKSDLREVNFDGLVIDAAGSVSIAGLERVISLKAKRRAPDSSQARIDHATAILSAVGTEYPQQHRVVDSEGELSEIVNDFMETHKALGMNVSFDIPNSSAGYIPDIARRFGVVGAGDLPGQYL